MKKYNKNRGFMFTELLVTGGIFIGIIFPLIMLMNKNIERVTDIRKENEIKRIAGNLENIFLTLLEKTEIDNNEINRIEGGYFLIPKENESFILKNENGKEITQMRNIKYFSNENTIEVRKKFLFYKENGVEKELTEIYILNINFENKNIWKILK